MSSGPAERFHAIGPEARGAMLKHHLDAASSAFQQESGADHLFFGVEAACYHLDRLGLIAPNETREFLAALAGVHGTFASERDYDDAKARLKRAKIMLHIALKNRRAA